MSWLCSDTPDPSQTSVETCNNNAHWTGTLEHEEEAIQARSHAPTEQRGYVQEDEERNSMGRHKAAR